MSMSAARLEHVRLSALRYCAETGEIGYMERAILQDIRNEGLRELTESELRAEMQYLADKGLITAVSKALSPDLKRWRVTAAGRDFLAEQGL